MIKTQRIRRLGPPTRRPQPGRPTADSLQRARRNESAAPSGRRTAAAPRPRALPAPARPARVRTRRLRLVVVNARPRRRRQDGAQPVLHLLRGRAPALASPRRAAPPPRVAPREPKSRIAQLAFVMAMAAVGLVALATSLGQVLTRGM